MQKNAILEAYLSSSKNSFLVFCMKFKERVFSMSLNTSQPIVGDSIKKFSKSKGYESLPRELLQSDELPLEAIGLLCNLQSYPDSWILRKTELRKRFVNSEKAVDRVWDILVEKGYILQFRRREGKKYIYQYFFNVEKFTLAEIQELLVTMYKQGMLLYHKSIKKGIESPDEIKGVLCLTQDDKDKLDLSFWTSQKRNSKEMDNNNNFWTSENGKSNLEIPNTEDSRFTNNKLTNKKLTKTEEEEENKLNKRGTSQDDEQEKAQIIFEQARQLANDNPKLQTIMKYLYDQKVELDEITPIIVFLGENPSFIQADLIKQQAERNRRVGASEGLYNYPEYFINGLIKFAKNINLESSYELENKFSDDLDPLPKVSMFNWLSADYWNV